MIEAMKKFFKHLDADTFKYALTLVVGSVLGVFASFVLTMEKMHLLTNPDYVPSCSINPVIACSPIITSQEASALGFPNSIIGIFGFACVLTVGMALLAGMKDLKSWFWRALLAGTTFGMVAVLWLMYVALFDVGKLCMYCSLVWVVTIPIFMTTLRWCLLKKAIKLPIKVRNWIIENYLKIIILCYVVLFLTILFRFWDFWIQG